MALNLQKAGEDASFCHPRPPKASPPPLKTIFSLSLSLSYYLRFNYLSDGEEKNNAASLARLHRKLRVSESRPQACLQSAEREQLRRRQSRIFTRVCADVNNVVCASSANCVCL
jgi:hypothetical protein